MKRVVLLVALLLLTYFSNAQQFGGTPAANSWQQINTDTARIIFPKGLDSSANRVASIVHYLAANNHVSLGGQLKKINIVLQNQTSNSNGYVGLGPFRSEFYLTAPPNSFDQGSIAWVDQLALHEYRHVQQFNNFNNGVSRFMKTIFGEHGYSVAINASIPDWFFEGDAVYQETVFSQQGRGRMPYFLNAYPSLWQDGKKYSWMKLRNGSLKNYVPNHYSLGFLLVNYGYVKYGTDFWKKVTNDASAFKGLFYPFQKAIKKYAGVDYKTFYANAFAYYQGAMNVEVNGENAKLNIETDTKTISKPSKNYVSNYLFPYQIAEDSILFLKKTARHLPAFYIKDGSGEHQLRVKDIAIDDQFSYRNGKLVYAAYQPDIRRGWQDFSVIKILDIQTKKQITVTNRTKYFSPDISANAEKIVAVQNGEAGKSELHLLNSSNGKIINYVKSTEIGLFADPKFLNDSTVIVAVRLKAGKMALAIVNFSTGSIQRITEPSFNTIGFLSVKNEVVYFSESANGHDDVFAVRISDKKIAKITNAATGNYFVNAGSKKTVWSSFTAHGFALQQMNEKELDWKSTSFYGLDSLTVGFDLKNADVLKNVLNDSIGNRSFAIEKYKKATRLFNFHSWRPNYEDPFFSFSLYGENLLNTLQTEVYYLYNQNEKTSAVGFNAVYGALFPHLSAGTELTFNRVQIVDDKAKEWNQLDTRIGINVPLNLTAGRFFRRLNVGTNLFYRREFTKGIFKNVFPNAGFGYLQHFINWSQLSQQPLQYIYPKWGYTVSANYRYVTSSFNSYQINASVATYLPGLANNHSVVLSAAFQQVDTSATVFSNRLGFSRGYRDYYFSRFWKTAIDYHLPLLHPDFGFANLLYIQRIRGDIFYDFSKAYSKDKQQSRSFQSAGIEIYFDTKWWNQYPVSIGFRFSRQLDKDLVSGKKGNYFELLLPVSIFPK